MSSFFRRLRTGDRAVPGSLKQSETGPFGAGGSDAQGAGAVAGGGAGGVGAAPGAGAGGSDAAEMEKGGAMASIMSPTRERRTPTMEGNGSGAAAHAEGAGGGDALSLATVAAGGAGGRHGTALARRAGDAEGKRDAGEGGDTTFDNVRNGDSSAMASSAWPDAAATSSSSASSSSPSSSSIAPMAQSALAAAFATVAGAFGGGGTSAGGGRGSSSPAAVTGPAAAVAAAVAMPAAPTGGNKGGAAAADGAAACDSRSKMTSSAGTTTTAPGERPELTYREEQFRKTLSEEVVDLAKLRSLSWNGVPAHSRPVVWPLLLGYLPSNRSRREAAIARKRQEFRDAVVQYFDIPESERTVQEAETLRQVLVDVPRTCPDVPVFHQDPVQRSMERILYIWAIRHPASAYVQGMNDLLTPIFAVFLSQHVGADGVWSCDVSKLDAGRLEEVEADSYWCLTKLLDSIHDHYTFGQPGLQRMVLRLEDLVHRIDESLHQHLIDQGLTYMQFAFRWMNCILMRELPLRSIVRLWDTYLAEDGGFENFHVYVCAVVLSRFSERLRAMGFQELLLFLQDLPTTEWTDDDIEPILAQAYILSTLFDNSPNHLA